MMNKYAKIFETHRSRLFRLAYGMLGRIAPAEDAVQDAFVRWQKQNLEQINSHRAYLSKIVNNICLDKIKSARSRREQYIGPDLPEPLLTAKNETPESKVELAESLSMALLVVLKKLDPVQRAVFILRKVFDYEYSSVAEIVDKSEENCRKIAQRALQQVQENKPHFEKNVSEQHKQLVSAFTKAVQDGKINEIENMLAEDAIVYSDGGGKVAAARKPVSGAAKIAKVLIGFQKQVTETVQLELTDVNGEPGMIVYLDGELNNVWSFHIQNDKIQSMYVVLNPEKLEHLKSKFK